MNAHLKLLLIEDSEDDALLVLRVLRRAGFELVFERVQTDQELSKALTSQSWDVIISDYRLPHFDAPAALRMVKECQVDLPFIVVSGTVGEASAVAMMKVGAHDYVMKDNLQRLPEAIHREIREAQVRKERTQVQLELALTKERLQLALDGSGIGLWDWYVQTGIMIFNERLAQMIGYELHELQPTSVDTWNRHAHPDDLLQSDQALARHFAGETQIYECEIRLRHRSGNWIWVLDRGKVTEWNITGQPLRMTGTHLDITDRKQAEVLWQERLRAELELKNAELKMQELERLSQLKDDFLSTVSHELRTPLNNMNIAIHLLKDNVYAERHLTYLEILESECNREKQLINDLLDLQRLEAGESPLWLEEIEIAALLPNLIAPFRERAQSRSQTLHVEISPEVETLVSDREIIERILRELLNNACKYTPPQGKIAICVNETYQGIQFQIMNTGPSIAVEVLPRIFDKFYRVSHQDLWQQGGTGLGLALVKNLVTIVQAQITVTSQEDETCFTLTIPQVPLTVEIP